MVDPPVEYLKKYNFPQIAPFFLKTFTYITILQRLRTWTVTGRPTITEMFTIQLKFSNREILTEIEITILDYNILRIINISDFNYAYVYLNKLE